MSAALHSQDLSNLVIDNSMSPFFTISALRDSIENAVQVRTGGRIRDLSVQIVDSTVLISGRATSYYSKQLVTQAALQVAERLQVVNEVHVH